MNTEIEPQVPEVRGIKRYQVPGRQIVASQISQYLDVMKVFLGRVLNDLQKHSIDETKKGYLKQKFREILMRRIDYSKPKQVVQILRDLRLPDSYGESFALHEIGGSRYGGGSYYRTTTAGAGQSWFDKILKVLPGNPETYKKLAPKIAIGAIIAAAASFFIYQVVKKVRLGNQTWKVIADDIHPVVFELVDLIIDGKVHSQIQINEILSQTEDAVIKKYSLEAVR